MSVVRLFFIQPSKAEPVVDNKPGSGQVVLNKNTVGNVGNVGNVGAAGSELKPGAKKTVIQVRESGTNTIFLCAKRCDKFFTEKKKTRRFIVTVIQASTSELLKCLGNFLYKRCYRCLQHFST